MEPLNRTALERVDEAIDFADELAVAVHELDNEATVVDFGVEALGGLEAGMVLAEIQTGGLAAVQSRQGEVAGAPVPSVEVTTDHPALALLCGQKAGWELSVEGFEGLGSGPARALVAEEAEFDRLDYAEHEEFATLAVETDALPGEAVADHVAERAGVEPGAVFLLAFATDSITGSVALAARAAEAATFRLFELGYDPADVLSATGSAPVAPVADGYEAAVGRTNDAVAYGGRVHLTVDADPEDAVDDVPSVAGETYGRPFREVFEAADWEFTEVPPEAFGPAQVTVDVVGGPTYVRGEPDEAVLEASFGFDRP